MQRVARIRQYGLRIGSDLGDRQGVGETREPFISGRRAHGHGFAQRQVADDVERLRGIRRIGRMRPLCRHLELRGRQVGLVVDQTHRAAQGPGAVQRPLRPA